MGDPDVVKFMNQNFSSEPVTVPLLRTTGDGDCFLRSILQSVIVNDYVTGNELHFKHIFSTNFIKEVEQELNLTTPYPYVEFNINNITESYTQKYAQPFLRILRSALIDKARVFFRDNQMCLESKDEWEKAKNDYKSECFDYLISYTSHIIKRHLIIFDQQSGQIIPQSGNAFAEGGTGNVVNITPILLARIVLGNNSSHYQILKPTNLQYWRSYISRKMKIPNNDEIIQECLRHKIFIKIMMVSINNFCFVSYLGHQKPLPYNIK